MSCLHILEYFDNEFQGDGWDHVGTATTQVLFSVCLSEPEVLLPREALLLITAGAAANICKLYSWVENVVLIQNTKNTP